MLAAIGAAEKHDSFCLGVRGVVNPLTYSAGVDDCLDALVLHSLS